MISIKNVFIAVALFITIGFASAQPQSLYFFRSVPQSHQLNPAFQPNCNVYVGIPGINSIYANGGNTALSLYSVVRNVNGQMVTALHPTSGFKDELYNSFKPGNLIFANNSLSVISFGFRFSRDWYFSYELNQKSNAVFSYPKEFAQLALYGNAPSNTNTSLTVPLKHFGFSSNVYIENAFGISRNISDEVSVGAKIKILSGIADVNLKNASNATLTASTEEWYINKSMEGHVGSIVPNLYVDNGAGDMDLDSNATDPANITKYISSGLFKNMGVGLDLGIEYKPSDIWSLSASVVDLGFIHYGAETGYNLSHIQDSAFQGVYVYPKILETEPGRPTIAQATLDTLLEVFSSSLGTSRVTSGAYTSFLSWKLYAGASCYVWPEKLSIGVLSKTQMYFKRLYQQVTVSANFFPARFISTTASYSIMNNGFSNIGLGLSLKLGPANLYVVTDYFPLYYGAGMIPYKTRMVNAQFGLNLMFGCGRKIKDRPLIESY